MRKLAIIMLWFLVSSCGIAQTTSDKAFTKELATVRAIVGDVAILDTNDPNINYQVAYDEEMEKGKEYFWVLDVVDCQDCQTRIAVIVDYAITPMQAQMDMNKMSSNYNKKH